MVHVSADMADNRLIEYLLAPYQYCTHDENVCSTVEIDEKRDDDACVSFSFKNKMSVFVRDDVFRE